MYISESDFKWLVTGLFLGMLCPACRKMVEDSPHELLELGPREWGFCASCAKRLYLEEVRP